MKAFKLTSLLALLLTSAAASAASTVITFEDVEVIYNNPLYGTANLSDGYGGISGWTSVGQAWATSNDSGLNEAIGNKWFYGAAGELVFNHAPVVFEGTYYKSYAADHSSPLASIDLYYQGTLVHSLFDPQASTNLVWLASDYTGLVDKILIRGGAEGFSIDNFTYSVIAVPEPGSLSLLLSGLSMLWLKRQRKTPFAA